MKSDGSGIQLPLLSHVTVSITSSQVNIKTKPSRVEKECSLMFLSTNGNLQSRSTARNIVMIIVNNFASVIITYAIHFSRVWFPFSIPSTCGCIWASQCKSRRACVCDELSLYWRAILRSTDHSNRMM